MHVKCLLSIFFLINLCTSVSLLFIFRSIFQRKLSEYFFPLFFHFHPEFFNFTILRFFDSKVPILRAKKKKKEMTTARNIDNLPIAFYHLLEQHNIALSFSCSQKSLLFPFSLSVLEISNERVTVSLREIGSHRERWRRSCSPSMSPGSGIRMWPIIIAA